MKALILNSGVGSRMGELTASQPKCLTRISPRETILSRQLRQIADAGVRDVVITTGPFSSMLEQYCEELALPLSYVFVHNDNYQQTNYIYSIYLARAHIEGELLLLHGDLVMEDEVFRLAAESRQSCMAVSSTLPLPEKDFKAVIKNGHISAVGVELFDNAVAAQPLYHLRQEDWAVWLAAIVRFCEVGTVKCYAENALNEVSSQCAICPLDVKELLCAEIDSAEDLAVVSAKLREAEG